MSTQIRETLLKLNNIKSKKILTESTTSNKSLKESLTSDEISKLCGKAAEALDDVLSYQEIFDNEFFTEHDLKVVLDCQELMDAAAYEFQGGSTFIYDDQSELTEDTIKTSKGKWVNKGDTGETHGTFKTKKEADAQRKAMFAQGHKVKEDLGSDIGEYQKRVDYDMKKYGKVSNNTFNKIKKAGLTIVKDRYGDWEVIAHKANTH